MCESSWPALPLSSWQDTKDTLHLYAQIVGKIKLALAPPEPEFGHVTFFVTSRGLTTGPMPFENYTLQIDLDFIAHEVDFRTSDGGIESIALAPRSVADFYSACFEALGNLNIRLQISPIPQEVADLTPLDQDTKHSSYDPASVNRFFRILSGVDMLFKRFRAPFRGRHTPVQFFWGSFDLCYDRFSGRAAAPPPGANYLFRHSLDAEQFYVGFWPGDARFPEPAFASYTYPKPEGLERAQLGPSAVSWNTQLGEFVLRYDDMRNAGSPEGALLAFFASAYNTSAELARWDRSSLE